MPNKFEQQIRDRLTDHSSEVDTVALWEAVEDRLEKKKRKRVIWWIPLIAACAALALYFGQQSQVIPNDVSPIANDSSNCKEDVDHEPEVLLLNKVAMSDGSQEILFPEEANGVEMGTDDDLQKKDLIVAGQGASTPLPLQAQQSASIPLLDLPDRHRARSSRDAETNYPAPTQSSLSTTGHITTLKGVQDLPIPLLLLSDLDDSLQIDQIASYEPTLIKRKHHTRLSIALQQTIGLPTLKISGITETGNPQLERNKASMTSLESFKSQLLLGLHINNRFFLRTGLAYRRINFRTDYSSSVIEELTDPEGILSIRVDVDGDSTFTYGPTNITRTESSRFRYYNSLTTLDIPLLLGYSFGKGKLQFSLEAGPVFNIGSFSKAKLLGEDLNFFTASNDTGWYKKRLSGVGFTASGTLNYPISRRSAVTLGVNYERTPVSGFEASNAGYQSHYNIIGVSAGVKMRF